MLSRRIRLRIYFLSFVIFFANLSLSTSALAAAPVLNSILLSDPDSGSTQYTNNSTISVSLSVGSGSPTQMILSKYSDFRDASWVAYANPTAFTFEIPTMNGTRDVYCKLKNASSEESNVAQGSICVDTFRPSISTANSCPVNTTHVDIMFNEVTIVGGDNPANYTITGGIQVLGAQFVWVPSVYLYKYRLATTPQTPGVQYTVTTSSNLQDYAGNLIETNGRTFTYTASSATDTTKPLVNSFSIQDTADYTKNRYVTISMTESDTGGLVSKWLITSTLSTPPSSAFTLASRPTSYTLSEGDGTKILYGWVMDDSGNISSYNPSSTADSIILDQTPPLPNAGSDKTAEVNTQVDFDGSGSSDSYQITSYVWDFGDGSPQEEGITASHTYTSEGSYLVTLTVEDIAGNQANDIATVTIGGPANPMYLKVRGPNPDYNTITDAMAHIAEGGTIYVYPSEYYEDIHMKENVILKGDDNATTILKGKVFFKEVGGTVDNFTILFNEGVTLTFINAYYEDFRLFADAGITVINAAPTIKNCIIRPDLELINIQSGHNPPFEHYGKAIQIWNLYEAPPIAPSIENNIIVDNDCGIFYFNQAFGGNITGLVNHNTFYNNNTGILLRMHKENPEIKNNIIYGNTAGTNNTGIFITYEDGNLFDTRKSKIHHNDVFAHTHNYWLDATETAFDLTDSNGNISLDPLFVDPSNGYFGLEAGSPCIGKADDGTNMGAIIEDRPIPTQPTVDPLPSLTNQQYITISGTKAAGTSIWINNEEVVLLDNETIWSVQYYNLGVDGDKILSVVARNSEGENSATVVVTLRLDSKRPIVTITSPENGATVTSTPVTITGTIDEVATVTVNGIPATVTGNSFTVDIPLTVGPNLITATARDPATNDSLPDYVIVGLNTSIPVITSFAPPDDSKLIEGSAVTVTANASDGDSPDLWYRFFVKGLLRQDWAKGRNTFDYYVSQAEVGLGAISVDVADSDPSGPVTPNIVSESSQIYNFRKPVLPTALE